MDGSDLAAWVGAHGIWILVAGFVPLALAEAAVAARARGPADTGARSLTNFGLGGMAFAIGWLLPVGLTGLAILGQEKQWGLDAARSLSPPLQVALALLVRSFAGYWAHRLSHAVPWLWRVHRVHHSDPAIDISTGFRHHPLELLVTLAFVAPPVLLLGIAPWAVALVELLLQIAALAEHANVRTGGRIWRWLGLIFATPAVHLIHHSSASAQTDSNYGSLLTLWDRLFGSWRDPANEPVERLGLGAAFDAGADRLDRQLWLPVAK